MSGAVDKDQMFERVRTVLQAGYISGPVEVPFAQDAPLPESSIDKLSLLSKGASAQWFLNHGTTRLCVYEGDDVTADHDTDEPALEIRFDSRGCIQEVAYAGHLKTPRVEIDDLSDWRKAMEARERLYTAWERYKGNEKYEWTVLNAGSSPDADVAPMLTFTEAGKRGDPKVLHVVMQQAREGFPRAQIATALVYGMTWPGLDERLKDYEDNQI